MENCFFPEGWLINNPENRKLISNISVLGHPIPFDKIIEARVTSCDSEHDLYVDLGGIIGVIKKSEGAVGIDSGKVRDIALISRVGKPVCFTVTDLATNADGKIQAVLSRKNAQKICYENYVSSLSPGDIVDARITHLDSFGAFCDIGCGVIALLPIDAISVSRISHPRDRFLPGQDIRAAIKSITPDGRITLTHKELLGTFNENCEKYSAGSTVSGIVRSVEDYGIFVELAPNLAGLAEPKEGVYPGQRASVYIKSIIPEKMKVKLIVIDSFGTAPPPKIEYFTKGNHISSWCYSPENCYKTVQTVF